MTPNESYSTKFRFINEVCRYKNHWCNGNPIPDIDPKTGFNNSKEKTIGNCRHYINGMCTHPDKHIKGGK